MRARLLSLFVRRRWVVVITISLFMLLLEVIENLVDTRYGITAHQLYHAALYVIGVPAGAWLLLVLLAGAETERAQASLAYNLQAELSQKLGETHAWEDIMKAIVGFAHQALPCTGITLSVMHPQTLQMQVEAQCTPAGEITLKPQNAAASSAWLAAPAWQDAATDPRLNCFNLPITRGDQRIGSFIVEYTPGNCPTRAGIRVVEGMLPMIALALDGALLQNLAADQAAASEAERQKIVQDLHDSLAQNISYLCLKLDQLTGETAIQEVGVILQELERMRATADEAYQQVRNTIDQLAVNNSQDLSTTVENQARAISSRAGFQLRTSKIGISKTLPAVTRQHIANIAREAFHNIEKHAQANQVRLQFIWLESELILKITDDGIGFHPQPEPTQGHYGMWIMQQRAQDIGGMIKISPADELGTEVTLWVPYLREAH